MENITISLMRDNSLCDLEANNESLFELLPTIYRVDVGNNVYELGDDSNEFMKQYSNATEVTIHLLAYKNNIEVEKVNW